jgi:hypothetical protein
MFIADKAHETQYDVRQGKRVIGFAIFINNPRLPGGAGWRFLANKKDIAGKMPIPAPVFATVGAVMADLEARLA